MKTAIKYISAAFAVFLAVSIIGGITTAAVELVDNFFITEEMRDGKAGTEGSFLGVFGTKKREVSTRDYEYGEENVKILNIEAGIENLSIKEGKELKVEMINADVDYEVYFENKELTIKAPSTGFFFGWLFNPKEKGEINITIPKGTTLEKLYLDAGVGYVGVEKIKSEQTEINSGTGAFIANDSDFGLTNIDVGTGKLELKDVKLKDAKIDGGTGSLSIKGELLGDTEIDCGTGSVTVIIAGDIEEYTIGGDKGTGAFRVEDGNEEIKMSRNSEYDFYYKGSRSSNTLEVSSGTGGVSIIFE
ncbi:MAG: DUF4097 domain-containing protein [Lachnospiraceae bacterium]|nr:DUF4097 domain-containing protein [Lachnospiraceae bacterium]